MNDRQKVAAMCGIDIHFATHSLGQRRYDATGKKPLVEDVLKELVRLRYRFADLLLEEGNETK